MNNFIKKILERDKFLVLLIFLILSLFFFRKVIVSPGTVGHLLDWPFPSEVKELQTYFHEAFYTWRSHALGYNEPFMVISLWGGFWGFFGLLGFSGEWVSKFCLLSLIPLAGFSMYLLLNELFPNSSKEKKINLPAFFGSLFYTVSPVMINQILGGAVLYLLSYGLSPLGLLIFIKGVGDKGINWSRGIILALLWAVAGIDNHFLIFWGILFLVYSVFTKERRIMYLKFLGFAVFLVFILHFYWLVGFFLNYQSNSATFQTTGANKDYLLNLAARSGPFTSVITLIANFNPILFKAVMSPHLIKAWFLACFALLIAIFSFSLVCLRKKIVLYALLIIIIGIFFAKGIYPPLGGINLWLYRNFVPMNLFRTLHHIQFLVVFGYSILVGNLFEYVGLKFKRQLSIWLTLSFLVFLTIYIHPLLTGNINNGVFTFQEPKNLTRIKETMDNLDKKLDYGGDYRILFFPTFGSVGFKGQRTDLAPGGSFPTVQNSPRPTLDVDGSRLGSQFAQYIEKNIYFGNSDGYITKLLALAEVRYLIPRNDLIYIHLPYGKIFWDQKEAYQKLLEFLSKQQELTKINSYPDMSLWENKDFLPHFYTPKTLIFTNQNLETLLEIVSQKDYDIRSAIYFDNISKESIENKKEIKFNPNELKKEAVKNTPILEFKKINPTKYRIKVHGAKGDLPIVFSESFNDGWKIYLGDKKEININNAKLADYKILDSLDYVEKYNFDFISKNFQGTIQNDNLPAGHFYETWFKQPINANHLMANGYANSWFIDVDEVCKVESDKVKSFCTKNPDGSYDFELIVEFWPQRLFYLGSIISGTVLILGIGYLIYDWKRKRKLIGVS